MRKIIGFELKKLVSRIGIYILVVLLAGLLVSGIFMHEPTKRDIVNKSLVGETVSELYNSFDKNLKQEYIDSVDAVAFNASTYVTSSPTYQKYNDSETLRCLFVKFDDYCLLYNETSTAVKPDYSALLIAIKQSVANFKTALDEALQPAKDNTGYYVLTTNQNYTKLYTLLNTLPIYSSTFDGDIYYNEFRTPIYNCLDNMYYPEVSNTAVKYDVDGAYYTLTSSRMEEISIKIEQLYQKAVETPKLENDKDIINEMNSLFNRYTYCAKVFEQAFNSDLCVSALSYVSNKTVRSNLLGYSSVSLYDQEEIKTEYLYYLENNVNESDFANSLSVTHTSNSKVNAYDFTYFVMSLFNIAVILFAIYLASHTISGEINNNTLRFAAIRPVKRGSLLLGKYFAIIIMSLVLLLFGSITSLCVGGIMYGFDSANILTIFNGTSVIVVHPLAMIGIMLVSNLLIVALYAALALLLSTLLKSDLLSTIISVVVYLVNLLLPLFFGIGSWLRFYPFANINLFAYFGSTSMTTDGIFATLFNPAVYLGMSVWISLIYVIGITILFILIAKLVFKKREL